jgi:1-acyl-sn-glycerol-3-phosphate acyltransferase
MSTHGMGPRCVALTREGMLCKNYVWNDTDYCRVHQSSAQQRTQAAPQQMVGGAGRRNGKVAAGERGVARYGAGGNGRVRPTVEVVGMADEEVRQALLHELDRMIAGMQDLAPSYNPPPFSPEGLVEMLQPELEELPLVQRLNIMGRLRALLRHELFDIETWKGLWYVMNYTLHYQAGVLKRRLRGEYEVDKWGFDPGFLQLIQPFGNFLYKYYWRVSTTGMAHVPLEGRALLVANHSGQLPFDGCMIGVALLNEHPNQRLVRMLYATWFPTLPFVSLFFNKLGQAVGTEENGIRLLEEDELVGVFPEGYKGSGKLFKDRYHLARFGRGGFARMALHTKAPIIPVSVVGAEETYISLRKSKTMAQLTGFPYFPISPTWPWLGLLGVIPLPTKWYIDFGEPIPMARYGGPWAAEDLGVVCRLTEEVRDTVQGMIHRRLALRPSLFFG